MALLIVLTWAGRGNASALDIVVQASPSATRDQVSDAIDSALIKARSQRQTHPAEAIRIVFRPGVYHLARPMTLGAADSGSPGAPLSIEAADKAPVRLLGSKPLGATPATGVLRLKNAKPQARAHLAALQIDASAVESGLTSLHRAHGQDNPAAPVILTQGARRLSLARWPARGYAQADRGPAPANKGATAPSFMAPRAARWSGESDLWAVGFWSNGWAYDSAPVAGPSPGPGMVKLGPLTLPYPLAQTFRYAVMNSASDIAAPGQYVLDSTSHTVLAWPFEAPSATPIELAVLPNLLVVDGAHDVVVSGVAFENAVDTGVVIRNSSRVTLSDGLVANVGADGVRVTGGNEVSVVRSVIVHAGQDGVAFSGGDRKALTPAHHRLSESMVVRFGELMPSYRPGVSLEGVGQIVERSYIADGPHMGIGFSGNDHRIIANELLRLVSDESDAGVIYAGRDVMARGNQISGNYIHDIDRGPPPLRDVRGIYLDDYLSGTAITENLLVGVRRSIFLNGGSDSLVQGNVFVAPEEAAITIEDRSRYWDANLPDLKAHGASGLEAMRLYASRYPGVQDAFGAVHAPRRNLTPGSFVITPAPNSEAAVVHTFPAPASFEDGIWISGRVSTPQQVCALLRAAGHAAPPSFPCTDRLSQLRTLRYAERAEVTPSQ